MPEEPENHWGTELAEVLFEDFVFCPHHDFPDPYIRITRRPVLGIHREFGGSGWSHTDCRLVHLEKAGAG